MDEIEKEFGELLLTKATYKRNINEVVDKPTPLTIVQKDVRPIVNEFTNLEYSKKDGDKDYKLIVLILEDAVESKKYFNALLHDIHNGVKIICDVNKRSGIKPKQMPEYAIKAESENALNYEAGDEIYFLCDLDHYRNQLFALNEQIKQEKSNWNLIISNPCVEIWFYYHITDNLPKMPIMDEDKYSQAMKKLYSKIRAKEKTSTANLIGKYGLESAINESTNHFSLEDNGLIPTLFATNMHTLAIKLNFICNARIEEEQRKHNELKAKFAHFRTSN